MWPTEAAERARSPDNESQWLKGKECNWPLSVPTKGLELPHQGRKAVAMRLGKAGSSAEGTVLNEALPKS